MSIAEKLTYLSDTKNQLRGAIQGKGITVPANTPFRDYVGKIAQIEAGEAARPKWVDSTWSEYVTSASPTAPAFAPGAIEEGDLLIMTLMTRREPSSVPAGFTEVLRSPEIGDPDQFMAVYEKVATGSEGSFPVSLSGTADRACVSVAAFRSSTTPVIASHDSGLIDTSAQSNHQIDLGEAENPSLTSGGLLVLGITTAFAATSNNQSSQINIPFYGWTAIHNTYGTSTSHQNRMMINAVEMGAGGSLPAQTPYVAMSNVDGLSTYKLLIAAPN